MGSPYYGGSPRSGLNSDDECDSPVSLSNYSSCDGSEFDRYCSANSVLGTASVCSSVSNRSELLETFRSLGLGDLDSYGSAGERTCGETSVRGAVSSGRFDYSSFGAVKSPKANGSYENRVFLGSRSALSGTAIGAKLIMGHENSGTAANHENIAGLSENPSNQASIDMDYHFQQANSQHAGNTDLQNLEEIVARYGHSDDEGSMLDSGTDEEDRARLYSRDNLQNVKDITRENVNQLLMGSAVAFGNNDWDDFEQEMEGGLSMSSNLMFSQKTLPSYRTDKVSMQDSCDSRQCDGLMDQGNCHEEDTGNMASHRHQNSTNEPSKLEKDGPVWEHLQAEACGNSTRKPEATSLDTTAGNVYSSGNNDILDGGISLTKSPPIPTVLVSCLNVDSDSEVLGENKPHVVYDHDLMIKECVSNDEQELSKVGLHPEQESSAATTAQSLFENDHDFVEQLDNTTAANEEVQKPDGNEFFDDMVLEMEEILLDTEKARQARYTPRSSTHYASRHSLDFRDGSSTASTSGTSDTNPLKKRSMIEWVEVIGARQKKGDVSFGERLVGVKEYTVYKLRVWSGKEQWEVERRYRDFYSLYRQLKKLYAGHGYSLPPPWSKVEQDSRKIFGNVSPNVVDERSCLIQDCLQSVLNPRTPFGTPSSLVWFLTTTKDLDNLPSNPSPQPSGSATDDASSSSGDRIREDFALGKKISLIVELRFRKSKGLLLEEQNRKCAGCHGSLDAGMTMMQGLVQTLGWGRPQLCEYTGQLYCATCHIGDTAVLPARVLHHWDFSLYPVSQLAKAYLESIYEQPMLCVSAVNPFLFSKVPALRHITEIRKKIYAMLQYVRCPFRRSIMRGLGSRRYLLESNDFFALRDLVDLSKGAFAGLPVIVENISSKILFHLTHQCLECYDVGVPCAASESCKEPSLLILPFQETEAFKCSLCSSIFHKPCVRLVGGCPCSRMESTPPNPTVKHDKDDVNLNGVLDLSIQEKNTSPSTGFLSNLLSKKTAEYLFKSKNKNPVILMSSLPSGSL